MGLPNLPFYRQVPQMKPLIWLSGNRIQPGKGYVSIRFRAKRLGRDVVGASVRIPALHAIVDSGLNEPDGNPGDGQREIILAGIDLPGAGKADLRRSYIAPQRITPLYPYLGQSIQAIVGLFALQIDNIGKSMLDLISTLVSPLQNPQLSAALGISKALRQGIDALLGTDNKSKLVAGWQMRYSAGDPIESQVILITPVRVS